MVEGGARVGPVAGVTVPRSGNYLLVRSTGPAAGAVVKFDHDGLEFTDLGADLPGFVTRALDLDTARLTDIASHLCFVVGGDFDTQWWIEELRDNRGNTIRTRA